MSNFKRATVVGGAPPRNALFNLRDIKIIEYKPVLPAGRSSLLEGVSRLIVARDLVDCT